MNNWITSNTDLLPDFIIGGAMKCGTSTLHQMLNSHPKIFIPKGEIGFFDIDNILNHSDYIHFRNNKWTYQSMNLSPNSMWDWYHSKFKGKDSFLLGEDSTTYLSSEIAAKRISLQKKKIKLIFLIRQPSLRSYSHYIHNVRKGRSKYSFEDTIRYEPFKVINRSLYKTQIKNYLEYFPKNRIKIILFEDFIREPESYLREVCDFLEIDYAEFPEDVTKMYSNKGSAPLSINLQLRKNRLLKNLGNMNYSDQLPFKFSSKGLKWTKLINKAADRTLLKMGEITSSNYPKINKETKIFLDEYFYRELQGIDELLDQDVLSKWFPQLHQKP